MEPKRNTPPELLAVQRELIALEPIFHRPEHGTTRDSFRSMTAEDFWEVGASGRRYSRDYVLDILEERYSVPHDDAWEAKEFYCQELAPALYLLTYTLHQGPRVTRRSTLWRSTSTGWKIQFHQGTIVEPS